jgi:hypothetical protein
LKIVSRQVVLRFLDVIVDWFDWILVDLFDVV